MKFKIFIIMLLLFKMVYADQNDALKQANEVWKIRHSKENALKAMFLYKKATEINNFSYEAWWKYGRSCYFYANYFIPDSDNEAQKQIYGEGKDACLKAVDINTNGVEGHFWLAAEYGSWAEANGVFKSLAYAKDIKKELEIVIKLDKKYYSGGGYRVLGRVYFEAPGWPISVGSNKLSLKYEKMAVEIGPEEISNYYFLADVLIAEGQKEEALKVINQGLSLSINPDNVTEDKDNIESLKTLKAELEKK